MTARAALALALLVAAAFSGCMDRPDSVAVSADWRSCWTVTMHLSDRNVTAKGCGPYEYEGRVRSASLTKTSGRYPVCIDLLIGERVLASDCATDRRPLVEVRA